MDVWLNNHFSCKDLESSYWNNHLHMDVSASREKNHPWSLTWLHFAKYIGNSRSWCGGWNIPSSLGKRKNIFFKSVPVGSCIFEIFDLWWSVHGMFFLLFTKRWFEVSYCSWKRSCTSTPLCTRLYTSQLVVLDFLGMVGELMQDNQNIWKTNETPRNK